jgi:hypothetical protein
MATTTAEERAAAAKMRSGGGGGAAVDPTVFPPVEIEVRAEAMHDRDPAGQKQSIDAACSAGVESAAGLTGLLWQMGTQKYVLIELMTEPTQYLVRGNCDAEYHKVAIGEEVTRASTCRWKSTIDRSSAQWHACTRSLMEEHTVLVCFF